MPKVSVCKNQKGFTLIELAIVLVIIGIILGAALKGPDLIRSARTKKFVNDIKKWEIAAWTHYDRRGRFPGDTNNDGIIGMETIVDEEAVGGDPMSDLNSLNLAQSPANLLTLGSFQFYAFLGSDYTTGGSDANQQNVLVICSDSACEGSFTEDEISFVESFDTAIDGVSDGTNGLVRGSTTEASADTDSSLATFATDLTTFTAWNADTSPTSLVYFFDRPTN